MTLIRCHVCRVFFPKRERDCPECKASRRPHNEALLSQRWATNLNRHALHADKHT